MLTPIRNGTARRLGLCRPGLLPDQVLLRSDTGIVVRNTLGRPVFWARVHARRGNEYLITGPDTEMWVRWHLGSQGPLRDCARKTDHPSGMCDR